MPRIQTGRAIVMFPYQSKGKTYDSVILGLERASGKYSLPGGQFDPSKDRTTLDTAMRELGEELNPSASNAEKVFTFNGNVCDHDVYVVDAEGTVNIQTAELEGIGFFNAGRSNRIPLRKLERHVRELAPRYFRTRYKRSPSGKIMIPGHHFKNWKRQQRS